MFALDLETARFYARAAQEAAHAIGLWDALPGTAAELSRATGTGAARLRALLHALVLDGTLRLQGGVFGLAGVPPPAAYVPAHGWGRLAEVLRADRPLPAEEGLPYQEHLLRANAGVAAELWRQVGSVQGPLLDLGGGLGAYTAAFLAAHDDATATLVDRPEVCAHARLGARATVLAGDLFATPLGEGFGVVLLANVLHLYGPEDCRVLLARAAAAGRRVVVVELAIADDRSGPPAAVYFALNMALYTEGGTVHGISDLISWVEEATSRSATVLAIGGTPDVIAVTS